MKIDYVIVSCDNNPTYSDFWEIVKKLWIDLIGIKPILVRISDNDNVEDHGDHIIHNLKSVQGIDTGFQSQVARMYVTKFYQDEVCLTSDIDMFPLSKKYFTEKITSYDDNSLVIFSSDAYYGVDRYPICYNAAKGKLFDEILNFEDTFEAYCSKLLSYRWGWDTDELFFGKCVNNYTDQSKIIKLHRGFSGRVPSGRIDRSSWVYTEESLLNEEYIDSHSLRPYSQNKTEVDKLVQILV